MFLQRDLNSHDLQRFNDGFTYYWDVYCSLAPSLNVTVQDLSEEPLVRNEFKRCGIDENEIIFYTVKALTLLIYVVGEINANALLDSDATSTICSLIPMVSDPENLAPDGRMAKYNIPSTIISTIILRQAAENRADPATFVNNALRHLHLPGWLHEKLHAHFRKMLKSFKVDSPSLH